MNELFELLNTNVDSHFVETVTFNDLHILKNHYSMKNKVIAKFQVPWYKYEIYAYLKKDIQMKVWNQKHPVEENITKHIATKGTKVRVWMVSRLGDIGVTDNIENPMGYDARGLDPEVDLHKWTFKHK